jgi:CRISPR/Cas system CMR-associated protein Cmr5 small subunit
MSDRLNHRIALQAEAAAAKQASDRPPDQAREYRAFCEGFPALLRTAGLLQSLVFLKAKGKHPHGTVLADFTAVFRQLGLLRDEEDIVAHVARLSTGDYLTWTRIADRSAAWHKRFAQALVTRTKESH